jgi:hypothetical protein
MPVAGGPFIQKTGILLEVDAADKTSYSGTGTTWINQITPGTFNGTLNNVSFNSSDANGALVFTGSNTFVDFGNLGSSLTSSFSFQVAFKPAPTASGQPYTILSYASASATSSFTFKLDYTSSNQTVVLTTFSNTGSQNIVYALSASVASGSWNIVHGTYGTQEATLYVNGLSQVYTVTTGSVVGYNASNRLYAGLNFGSTSGYYSGSIANIIVNNADLNITAVTTNYNSIASRFGLPLRTLPSVDADANSFFRRVAVAGGLLTELEQLAITQLVIDLKAYGIWDALKIIYPMVGGAVGTNAQRAAAFAQNLKSSLYTGSFTNGGSYTSDGFNGNGTTAHMKTGFIPSTNLISSSVTIAMYQKATSSAAFGMDNSGLGLGIIDYAGTRRVINGTSVNTGINWAGWTLGTRVVNNELNIYRNNTLQSTNTTVASVPLATTELQVGSYFGGDTFTTTTPISFVACGDGLASTVASNFYTAVQRFNTSLSRQV